MPASALVHAADAALRVASLNLCTDELLLLLGEPRQIVSVSHLGHSPRETALWRTARSYRANDGKLESVLALRPQLILTMGGSGGARQALARRFGARLVELEYPSSPAEVVAQAAQVAALLQRPAAARPYRQQLARLESSQPALEDGAFVGGGGISLSPQGLGASWLRLAGFRQPALANSRLGLEILVTTPPRWLIRSDYRADQASRGAAWLDHPVVRRLAPRTLVTDGRPWTCGGLPMLAEVERLRALRASR
ncbi:iron complex transport system substrate-binding protein [Sphingomonas kaistensis]|uniref:Iron complex transport system substrate-binding protein n=1 Tax=Sphingomonas kaistensis TaxID=298708 RepID=A0A7X5YA09_9SPHN|nr:ABC transporter substrate-binding protein [Sphingomonas kaistensis]NJC06281.1 iron complex transport system substrate-binding protein [Sphingomonas kaistensis]